MLSYFIYQTLYPEVELDDVDRALLHGLELTKAMIVESKLPGIGDLEDWLLPTRMVQPARYAYALEGGAWDTAYSRYCKWCKKQKNLRYVSHRSRTSPAGAPNEVCALLDSSVYCH